MTEQTVNIPLLRKAVEWAEAEAAKPWELSEWYQALWETNPQNIKADITDAAQFGVEVDTRKAPECGTCYCVAGYVCSIQGLVLNGNWDTKAADILGIGRRAALDLFYPCNTIEDVRRIAEEIAGERL